MTSFTFDDTIPASANNPSSDQPIMLNNNVANANIWDVDHVGFNTTGSGGTGSSGGQHLQVTFNAKQAPVAPTDPISVLYTVSGVASTNAYAKFRNASGVFPISMVRAWAQYTGVAIPTQSINVANITVSLGIATVTLTAGATTGTDFAVIVTPGSQTTVPPFYTITGANTFTISLLGALGTNFSFLVLQA